MIGFVQKLKTQKRKTKNKQAVSKYTGRNSIKVQTIAGN